MVQRLTSVELPRQLERKETGLVLMQVLCLVEYPLLLVIQPLLQAESGDQSDQVAVLVMPGLMVFLTQCPEQTSITPHHPLLTHLADRSCWCRRESPPVLAPTCSIPSARELDT